MLNTLRAQVEQARGRYNQLQVEKKTLLADLIAATQRHKDIEQAKEIFRIVGQQTQQRLGFFVSDIGSLALASVFDDPYGLKAEFVQRRGKTECDLWFEREGQLIRPLDAAGGGPIDIASLGLRLSLWSLNKNRPVIVLDEPFKHTSSDLHNKTLALLKRLSDKLNIQIIMVSHSKELITGADKTFHISKANGVSHIK